MVIRFSAERGENAGHVARDVDTTRRKKEREGEREREREKKTERREASGISGSKPARLIPRRETQTLSRNCIGLFPRSDRERETRGISRSSRKRRLAGGTLLPDAGGPFVYPFTDIYLTRKR